MAVYAIHDKAPKFMFIINYKVMYSTLKRILPQYFPDVRFINRNDVRLLNLTGYKKFAIVRNPYHRAVSAYFDKSIKHPKEALDYLEANLQFCQAQLLYALRGVRGVPYEIAVPGKIYSATENPREREALNRNFRVLKSISFEEYVTCLTLILKGKSPDGHFYPQTTAFFSLTEQLLFWKRRMKDIQIFKMENIEIAWDAICGELGREMPLEKRNVTQHLRTPAETFYTEQTRRTVAELYKTDFKRFGYPLDLGGHSGNVE